MKQNVQTFQSALATEPLLQIVGVINAYTALLAVKAGFKALYLSGAGVANACFGLPDLGLITLTEIVEEAKRITRVTSLPLLVDIDTGFGSPLNIARAIPLLEESGVAAVHIEDQINLKRCGHRSGKHLVDTASMCIRIKTALQARTRDDFCIIARTDAFAIEGLEKTIARAKAYENVGAHAIFAEGFHSLNDYHCLAKEISIPILANMTEFGVTPLYDLEQLKNANVAMVLYPLTAFRSMSKAAFDAYQYIRQNGHQQGLLNNLQTRNELYENLNYSYYEQLSSKYMNM